MKVPDFDPAQYIEKKEIKKMDTFIHYAVGASQMAVDDAGLKVTPDQAERVGVYIGSGIGGLPAIERTYKILLEKGCDRVTPFFIPMVIINLASGQVAIRFGAKGPNSCAVTACAQGGPRLFDTGAERRHEANPRHNHSSCSTVAHHRAAGRRYTFSLM